MKTAKSYKLISIISLFAAVVIFFSLAFGMMSNRSKVSAASNPTDYLTLSEGVTADYSDGLLVLTVKDGSTVTFKNKLVISELLAEMSIPANVTTTLKMVSDSYYVNGNKTIKGEDVTYETSIVNEFSIKVGATLSDPISCSLNGGATENATLNGDFARVKVSTKYVGNVVVGIENTSVVGSSNSVTLKNTDTTAKRIKDVNNMAVATVSLSFDFADDNTAETAVLKIKSINQKFDDPNADKYAQTFEVDANGALTKTAYPRVALNDSFYTRDLSGGEYKAIKVVGEKQTNMTLTPYSVLGGVSNSSIYLSGAEDDVLLESGTESPKKLIFKKTGDISFNVVAKAGETENVYETYTVKVVEKGKDATGVKDVNAPKYKDDDFALEAFNAKLKEEYMNGDKHVPMGTDLDIPSLEDLVYDDVTPYNELTYSVHVKTLTNDTTLSSMEIELDEVGSYRFYIVFTDKAGNSIEEENFMKENDEGGVDYGTYEKFIFEFVMQDDAEMSVTASVKNGIGYKGVQYSAAKFNVDANGCTMTYKLYYNEDVDATEETKGWKEIPKASSVTDEEYISEDGYTFEEIKGFAYDGQLNFVPTKLGAYKIECRATSDVSSRDAEDFMIIKVQSEPSVVKVDNKWLQNNIWSVVFLSIGTLCLIGIIVLLCIKPKEESDD